MFWELQFTLNFVKEFLAQNNLLDLYQQLITLYQQAQTDYKEELEKNIEDSRAQIAAVHNQINFSAWSAPKISILKQIKANGLIGPGVLIKINKILTNNLGNSNAVVQKLQELRTETGNLQTKVDQLIQNLNLTEPVKTLEEDHQVVGISFEDNANLENFWEMKDRSDDWVYIIRTFTRLTDKPFDSAKFISITTASPLGIDLDMFKNTAEAIIAAAKAATELKKLKDMLFVKKKEAEKLELEKDTLKIVIKEIEQKHTNGYEQKIGELSVEITKQHRIKKPNANDEHEMENMVKIALDKMANLITDGAKVVDPSEILPQGAVSETTTLGGQYAEIKKLEKDITPLLEEENQKRLEGRRKEMLKEVEGEKENKKQTNKNQEPSTKDGENKKPAIEQLKVAPEPKEKG